MSMRSAVSRARGRARGLRLLAVVLALLLVAAACGGNDDDTASPSDTDDAAEAPDTTTGDTGDTDEGTPAPRPLPDKEKIVISMSGPIEPFASVLLADYFGEFEKENLEVEIQFIPNADGTVLLSRNAIQVQLTGINASTMNLISSGEKLRYVASTFSKDAPEAGFYIHKSFLDSNGEPDGEKIATSRMIAGIGGGGLGNPGALSLWKWLLEKNIPTDRIEFVSITAPVDAANALINGQVSIGIGLTPFWAQIVDSGCCEFVVPTVVSGAYLSNSDFLEGRPEVAQAFFRALMRTNRKYLQGNYKENPEVLAALVEKLQQPEENVLASPPLTFSPELEIVLADVWQDFQDQFRAAGAIQYETDLTPEQVFDTSPVEAVLAEEK